MQYNRAEVLDKIERILRKGNPNRTVYWRQYAEMTDNELREYYINLKKN